MKVYVITILTLLLVSALDQYSNLKTQVGQSCATTDYMTITNFDVEPWPVVFTTTSVITLAVFVNQPGIGIGEITYGILKNQVWTYQSQEINSMFPQNTTEVFQYIMDWPSEPGNYAIQAIVEGMDVPPTIYACWIFIFSRSV
ncbi:hypothetical protein SteCoe_26203 [Stentor coeruleus]|uniref:MD-2-related lipid-recognition domain-containing protein n=1 Tax=Stentor coeruleus TaxID=5963 RepID=A0A1R2BDD5_9CILI|nr:hypothetical protein SteCoe_26203 [Stentor coeruleus]